MSLTDRQVLTITEAGVLMAAKANVLSDFEVETLADIGRRFLEHRRAAVVTDLEWRVVEDAVGAMRAALPRFHVRKVAA